MEEELEKILKEKYNRDRRKEWESKIPIPKPLPKKRKSKFWVYAILMILGISLVAGIYYWQNQKKNTLELVDEYISTTPVASLSDLNQRNSSELSSEVKQDLNEMNFYNAVKLLRNGEVEPAIKLFQSVSSQKNKYQIEAIWFNALAYAKVQDNPKALHELEKLMALDQYQNDKAKELINLLSSK